MREEDYANVPDEVMAEYFAEQDRRRGRGTCRTCAHYGCCDTYCGGCYWEEEMPEEPEEDSDEEDDKGEQ